MADGVDWEEVPPDPGATIESLRSLGYSPGSAIADLIDNSLAAGATEVRIVAEWPEKTDPWVAVIDNGCGMTEDLLRQAMRIGSTNPLDQRTERDLGRFGFGLKTASFSQSREVTVTSKTKTMAAFAVRAWDLDRVQRTGRWMLRRSAPSDAAPILATLQRYNAGTTVLWRRLTTLATDEDRSLGELRREFRRHLGDIAAHLAEVFGRFLATRRLKISVNGHTIAAWDPFLTSNDATQELGLEELKYRGQIVTVRPYVLPHEMMLRAKEKETAGGPNGWNEQQGFYVYRGDRLITAGDWLGLGMPRDDLHNLARISVDIPSGLDLSWKLDITKASVHPPDALRKDLIRIAQFTRKRAAGVKRHRGAPVRKRGVERVEQLWVQRATRQGPQLRINRTHPLVAHVLREATTPKRDISALLSVLEETIPVLLLPAERQEDPPLADEPPETIARLAEVVYESLLKRGLTRGEARQRLVNTEPFNMYPHLLVGLGE